MIVAVSNMRIWEIDLIEEKYLEEKEEKKAIFNYKYYKHFFMIKIKMYNVESKIFAEHSEPKNLWQQEKTEAWIRLMCGLSKLTLGITIGEDVIHGQSIRTTSKTKRNVTVPKFTVNINWIRYTITIYVNNSFQKYKMQNYIEKLWFAVLTLIGSWTPICMQIVNLDRKSCIFLKIKMS